MSTLDDLADDFPAPERRRNPRKEYCAHGHRYTEENTVWRFVNGRKKRTCRICKNASNSKWNKRTDYERKRRLRAGASPSRLSRARSLLQSAVAFVDAELAAKIKAFLED